MLHLKAKQLLLILAGVFLGILIYLAPRQHSADGIDAANENVSHEDHTHDEADLTHDEYENRLDAADSLWLKTIEEKAEKIADIETKLNLYDSLIELGIKRNVPPIVANFTEKKALVVPTETNWMLAGDNYFKAFRLSKEKPKKLIEAAIKSYEEVIKLNADNLQAQTAIGVASVEGASQLGIMPMKGIGILKEVLNKDPENVDALTNLGYFAIQSGQYEKAIERFETVLSIDPENAEAYIYLTDIYLSQNDIEKGIETLEKYKSLVNDELVKQEVDAYIKEIKHNNNI